MKFKNFSLLVPFAISFTASGAHAASPTAELIALIDANNPRMMCLAASDDCGRPNSEALKAIKAAIDSHSPVVFAEANAREMALLRKGQAMLKTTNQYQQAKVRQAAVDALAINLAAYAKEYGSKAVAAALDSLASAIDESIATFTKIETQAAAVSTGRNAYLTARLDDFMALHEKIDGPLAGVAALQGAETALAIGLKTLPASPLAVFDVTKCGFEDKIYKEASVDLYNDFDFISRLTNAENLKLTCKDTTKNRFGIGASSEVKYNSKSHTLNFDIGQFKDTGHYYYRYSSFEEGYRLLKKAI